MILRDIFDSKIEVRPMKTNGCRGNNSVENKIDICPVPHQRQYVRNLSHQPQNVRNLFPKPAQYIQEILVRLLFSPEIILVFHRL